MSKWVVQTDGGCPKPQGPGAYAFVIKEGCTYDSLYGYPEGGTTLVGKSGFLPSATNNVAEYKGIAAAAWHLRQGQLPSGIEFWSDSQLIVYQLTGKYRVSDPTLRSHYEEAAQFIDALKKNTRVTINWFRREWNTDADALCNAQLVKHGVNLKKKGVKV